MEGNFVMNKLIKAFLVLTLSLTSIGVTALPLAYVEGEHYKLTTQRLAVSGEGTTMWLNYLCTLVHIAIISSLK